MFVMALSIQCFTYNVPHGDDAHMVFTALPNHVEDDVEDWFVSHMNEMTRKGGDQFMKELPETPANIKKVVDEVKEERTGVSLRVQAQRQPMIVRRQFKDGPKHYQPLFRRIPMCVAWVLSHVLTLDDLPSRHLHQSRRLSDKRQLG